ncbi:hypothetical protein AB1Y20_021700 [Prymnesium parvum]|uniref:Uncharacterized protein n=1 Tax=Prymnesium parvum TaxID=97485 RepID=A0AB34JM88_PRYPA
MRWLGQGLRPLPLPAAEDRHDQRDCVAGDSSRLSRFTLRLRVQLAAGVAAGLGLCFLALSPWPRATLLSERAQPMVEALAFAVGLLLVIFVLLYTCVQLRAPPPSQVSRKARRASHGGLPFSAIAAPSIRMGAQTELVEIVAADTPLAPSSRRQAAKARAMSRLREERGSATAPCDASSAWHSLERDKQLFEACYRGDSVAAAALLAAGASPRNSTPDGSLAIVAACTAGAEDCLLLLLAHGADANQVCSRKGTTPLIAASLMGHPQCARVLLEHGANPDLLSQQSTATALLAACHKGCVECVRLLCDFGADPNLSNLLGFTPLAAACYSGNGKCAQLLCTYGAKRRPAVDRRALSPTASHEAEQLARDAQCEELAAWLRATQDWCSPLHHVSMLSAQRTRSLLRDGADIYCRAHANAPTPVQLASIALAHAFRPPAKGYAVGAVRTSRSEAPEEAPESCLLPEQHHEAIASSTLVVLAAQPWSPANHELFPRPARSEATSLFLIAHQLARQYAGAQSHALVDVWLDSVIPLVINR